MSANSPPAVPRLSAQMMFPEIERNVPDTLSNRKLSRFSATSKMESASDLSSGREIHEMTFDNCSRILSADLLSPATNTARFGEPAANTAALNPGIIVTITNVVTSILMGRLQYILILVGLSYLSCTRRKHNASWWTFSLSLSLANELSVRANRQLGSYRLKSPI
jgi:hypothetical protein